MRRLALLLLLLVFVTGCATTAPSRPVIAVLLSDDVRMAKVDGLRYGLAALGYPSDAVQIEVYSAKGDRTALPAMARQVMARRPTVAVAGGGVEAPALKELDDKSTPIVLMGVSSTVRADLVDSFARPGGLITGLDNQHAELSAKRLELLTKLLPNAKRILLLYDPLVVPGQHALEVTLEAGKRLGVSVTPLAVQTIDSVPEALKQIQPGDYDGAVILPAFLLESGAHLVAQEIERLRLPAIGPLELEGEAGLLAVYGVSLWDQGLQSARFVAKILQGEAPGQIPVETPDNPELIVDMAVAKRLGVSLSPTGMAFARTRGEVKP